ncbi:MAG: hydroxymethylbilane synthase [Deltaproteobacteria bacterium]|nr:hydroxymethylbilane synthase [Deltaproteobacteria bacterium]
MILRIGTRGSRLALAQSEWVRERVEARHQGVRVELVRIKTRGDKILDTPLSLVGGKGLFVKEIEESLLRGEVDAAVHSMKDVPTELPEGLGLRVFPEREDPRDVLVSARGERFEDLCLGARLGTSSLRRGAQLLHRRPDLEVRSIRGNVETRLKKPASGEVDAIVLAAAGLRRLGLEEKATQVFPPAELLPAMGQGALGVEMRLDDRATWERFRFLNHEATELRVRAERALLGRLEGGCQVPIAGHAILEGDSLFLEGLVAELDGSALIADEATGPAAHPEEIGIRLADSLLAAGAGEILQRVYGGTVSHP